MIWDTSRGRHGTRKSRKTHKTLTTREIHLEQMKERNGDLRNSRKSRVELSLEGNSVYVWIGKGFIRNINKRGRWR